MDLGINGKRALVCASSRGLGLGCARALAEAGVDLVMKTTEKTYVFLAKTEQGDLASVRSVPVMVLGRNGDLVAVSGRLSEGDWVIVAEESTLLRLHEGMKVQVTEKAK